MVKRSFASLSPEEILALAMSLEEEDARILGEFARQLRGRYPEAAEGFVAMQKEEQEHHDRLSRLLAARVGDRIPFIRREDVNGFVERPPLPAPGEKPLAWYKRQAALMERETEMFYLRAAARSDDPEARRLLADLAEVEQSHERRAAEMPGDEGVRPADERSRRELFILQVVQPGLVGLMDGSVSTLAPVFAAAIATQNPWDAFLVGVAASLGAAISMGIAEGMSDDGALTGRGRPLMRGIITGLMTFAGGIGHALPFLIPDLNLALWSAVGFTAMELGAISWIRRKYMDMPFWRSTVQVVLGGSVVVATGILIGGAH